MKVKYFYECVRIFLTEQSEKSFAKIIAFFCAADILIVFFDSMDAVKEFLSSPFQMAALFACAFLIGMSKTGIQGVVMLSIPVMALAFGAKESTGVILPMLCFADIIAVVYYRRQAQWKYILKLVPAAVLGFFVAIFVDSFVPHESFKMLMGACILSGLFIMALSRKFGNSLEGIFQSRLYAQFFGLLGGFTTMIGNAAGPVMSIYLLSVKLPKLAFVGTSAWFFMIVNYLKVPLQIFAWDNISWSTIAVDSLAVPFIFAGAAIGVWAVKKMPEGGYRAFVEIVTALSALILFF